jgi:hypothetical protein
MAPRPERRVLATGLVLGMTGARRGFFLAALVPLALTPFSYARLRLHDTLVRAVGVEAALAVAGIGFDVVLLAQIVTARAADPVPLLQGPVVAWFGPVWFSGHALLFVGYGLLGLARSVHRLLDRAWALVTRRGARLAVETAALDAPASFGRRELLRQMSVAPRGTPVRRVGVGRVHVVRLPRRGREIVVPGWPRSSTASASCISRTSTSAAA